ncbi:FAD-dependent monooxygenase [Dactylosporangium sp. CA-139066]|uniref:FAD-dependent monooxygenase n=1 Tax=Dactylosporangium sp. CA-139066 TaxID=3239930 RepID=UPI003D90247A
MTAGGPRRRTQVAVVGAGPVGLMLAGELRLGGADVLVLEALDEPVTESRASTVHARTMEIFDERGLLDPLGRPPHERRGHFGGIPLDLGELPSRYAGLWKVPQARLERLLAKWAGGLGADLRRAHRVTGLDASAGEVRLTVAGPAGVVKVVADYVVGCDGERSTVRDLAGIPLDGVGPTRRLIRADVAGVDIPNRRFQRLPGGLAIAARTPDGVTRVMMAEHDGANDGPPPSFVDVVAVWRRLTGEDLASGRPLWVNGFDDASRQARRYRSGRVLLAGDAAHQQMPVGGQAMNLGLQDAVNLGWKLAATVAGRAAADLLDTYHAERYATGARVLGNIRAQSHLLLGGPQVEAARMLLTELIAYPQVRDRLGGMISGLDVRYGDDPDPLVGRRMPAAPDADWTAPLRAGRGALLCSADDRSRRSGPAAALSGWIDRVRLAPVPPDPARPPAVLLRPDGHIAWTGDHHGDPRPALRRWFGAPAR